MRCSAADAAFCDYVFVDLVVAETSGWEYKVPGIECSRVVYFENADGDASIKGHFTVVFEDTHSAVIREAYAVVHGNVMGHSTTAPSAPAIVEHDAAFR